MWGPQRPKFWILAEDFGFWGFWILDLGDFGFWILDLGDFGFWILGPKSKIQNPQSKIQNPNFFGRFWGFWILDFGPLCSNSLCGPKFRGFWILDFGDLGFWIWGILDFGFGDFGFWILDLGDFGFWILGILDFGFWGFWILDFGPLCSKSLCEAPNAPNLGDFGFWNLEILGILGIFDFGDFGFWILGFGDFGFWILEFGDFGFWILDFVTNFGCYIRKEDCARRTGSADFCRCFLLFYIYVALNHQRHYRQRSTGLRRFTVRILWVPHSMHVSNNGNGDVGGTNVAEPRYFPFLLSILGWSYWQRRWVDTSLVICLMVCL